MYMVALSKNIGFLTIVFEKRVFQYHDILYFFLSCPYRQMSNRQTTKICISNALQADGILKHLRLI